MSRQRIIIYEEFEFGEPATVSVKSKDFEESEGEGEFESFVEELEEDEEESQYALEEDFFDTGTFQSEEQEETLPTLELGATEEPDRKPAAKKMPNTTPRKSPVKSSAKVKSASSTKKKTAAKKNPQNYEDFLAAQFNKMNVEKAEEGVSKSGDGTSNLVCPVIKWTYTENSQQKSAVHIHLPSAWGSTNMSEMKLVNENKSIEVNFNQLRNFIKKARLTYGDDALPTGHVKVEAFGREIDRMYKTKLVRDNNKKYPYTVTVDLPFEVETRFDVDFKTYNLVKHGQLIVLELDFESVEKPLDTYTTKIRSEEILDILDDSDDDEPVAAAAAGGGEFMDSTE